MEEQLVKEIMESTESIYDPYVPSYFLRVRTRKYGNCVYEMDNLSVDAVCNKLCDYLNDTYTLQLWDNVTEEWISPEQFRDANL